MSNIPIQRHGVTLLPDSSRVIIRPFIPGDPARINSGMRRALVLTDAEVNTALDALREEFESRHHDFEGVLLENFSQVKDYVNTPQLLSRERELLIGGMFSGEYSLESAALFNPSIVPHPDQSGVPEGGLRFVMSLRATGEGHISSIEFRGEKLRRTVPSR